jgi:nitrogen fixation protein NifU and related proteins
MDDELYQANILDHYRHPRCHGILSAPTCVQKGDNPSCGDALELSLNITEGKILDGKFQGEGCAISQAATSMLLEQTLGKSIESVIAMTDIEMRTFLGVPIGESREKCMMLGLDTLKKAIQPYAQAH